MELEKDMGPNELRKAGLLLVKAAELDIDASGYGVLGVNKTSGNVYLWLEDQRSTLYIDLGSDEVNFLRSCPNCGEEKNVSETDRDANMTCECGEEM